MEVSYKEVTNAILSNDTVRAAEILEGFKLFKGGATPLFTSAGKDLVAIILGFASAMDRHDNLSNDLAKELIERTSMTVDIFQFLQLVMAATGIKQIDNFNVIPKEIRTALSKNNDCSDKIACAIEELDDKTFEALIAFITTDKVKRAYVKFNLPIIRHIYVKGTIPAYLIFAYMGLCLRQPIDLHVAIKALHNHALPS